MGEETNEETEKAMRSLVSLILGCDRDNPTPSVPVVEPVKKVSKYNGFSVEHYPLTNRWYPKIGEDYMKKNPHTGIIEKRQPFSFTWADYAQTEEGAWAIIDLYIEHWSKVNVQIFTGVR